MHQYISMIFQIFFDNTIIPVTNTNVEASYSYLQIVIAFFVAVVQQSLYQLIANQTAKRCDT